MSSIRNQHTQDTDIYINPASQEIYADFYNGMLGTDLTWEQIFEQTDRDINLQRVMNVMIYGKDTACHDWIPDRAIGPTDDALYESEAAYSDADLGRLAGLSAEEIGRMPVTERRARLMSSRKAALTELIQAYYGERGWTETAFPDLPFSRNPASGNFSEKTPGQGFPIWQADVRDL